MKFEKIKKEKATNAETGKEYIKFQEKLMERK